MIQTKLELLLTMTQFKRKTTFHIAIYLKYIYIVASMTIPLSFVMHVYVHTCTMPADASNLHICHMQAAHNIYQKPSATFIYMWTSKHKLPFLIGLSYM